MGKQVTPFFDPNSTKLKPCRNPFGQPPGRSLSAVAQRGIGVSRQGAKDEWDIKNVNISLSKPNFSAAMR